jgi:hypothetical protein
MQNKLESTEFIPNIDDLIDDKIHLITELSEIDNLIKKVQANCKHIWITHIIDNRKSSTRELEVRCSICNLKK